MRVLSFWYCLGLHEFLPNLFVWFARVLCFPWKFSFPCVLALEKKSLVCLDWSNGMDFCFLGRFGNIDLAAFGRFEFIYIWLSILIKFHYKKFYYKNTWFLKFCASIWFDFEQNCSWSCSGSSICSYSEKNLPILKFFLIINIYDYKKKLFLIYPILFRYRTMSLREDELKESQDPQ